MPEDRCPETTSIAKRKTKICTSALLQLLLSGISRRLLRRWVADALVQPETLGPLANLRRELMALDELELQVEALDDPV